ncbi:sensor histidine kinase [Paenibacillus sp. FSL H7-0326]|uniref:cache domain-containing sensor histidine kinase n=1 Tax=Paenibacillus sp. FSL H7-0326 TaxID=1921144 RepID=UPI0015C3D03C|nr:sensor histidine kinase [Paenibacillus sp. FSL H7-0326]
MDDRKNLWWQIPLRYKLVASVLFMTVPLVAMLIYNNFYAIHTVRGQVADSYKNMLNLYMSQIDSSLNDIDAYLNNAAGSGYDLISLSQAVTDTEYYKAKIYLYKKLSNDVPLYRSLSSFFVYIGSKSDYMDVPGTQDSHYEERMEVQSYLIKLIESDHVPKGMSTKRWFYFQIGKEYYIADIVRTGDVVIGGWLKTDVLLNPLHALQIGEEGNILLADDQGRPITATLFQNAGVQLHLTLNNYELSGAEKKFLVVGAPSSKGNFNLVALIPDRDILAKLPYLQGLIWFITASSFLLIPIGLYFMRRALLVPIYRILMTMKKVRQGDWSSRVAMNDNSEEFQTLGDSFNEMMTEIQALRTNVFEEQLNKQREELQRLQLQVNPHFFLNSLNIVYTLAKVQDYALIQEMTMSLIRYFRFMFRSNTSFVKLKDELEHIQNYMRIQMLRFPEQLTWSVEVANYLKEIPIPPLIIQSFVENAIKHAVTMDESVQVLVWIDELEDEQGPRMLIRIQDTGPGFPKEMLQILQSGRSVENELGENTGIWNAQRRLKLLYGDQVTIQFYNQKESGGAVVEMTIPIDPVMEGSA